MRADRRLYVDKDWTRLVPEGSAEAAFLLNAPGQDIEAEMVKRLGLVEVDGTVQQQAPEPEPLPLPEPTSAYEAPAPEEAPKPILPPESRRSRRKY